MKNIIPTGLGARLWPAPAVLSLLLPTLLAFSSSAANAANNTLEAIHASRGGADAVEIVLRLSQPPTAAPRQYTLDKPPRLVLDLPNTHSALKQTRGVLRMGAVRRYDAASAGNQTRLVLTLDKPMQHSATIQGSNLVVRFGQSHKTQAPVKRPNTPPATRLATNTAVPQYTKPVPARQLRAARAVVAQTTQSDIEATVLKLDFRRGNLGQGRVAIDLRDNDIPVDVRTEGKTTVIELPNAKLKTGLNKHYDVMDFGTPVAGFKAQQKGSNTVIRVTTVAAHNQLSYQANKRLTVEFVPLTKAEQKPRKEAKYSGEKITLDFQNIEVRRILQILADFSEVNIVVNKKVTGAITLRLDNVPWDQALDIILESEGLAKRQMGNVIAIAPAEDFAKREQLQFEARQKLAELVPLQTEYIQVNYGKAVDYAVLLKPAQKETNRGSLISARGSVSVDERTNALIIQDTAEQLEQVRALIKKLDIPVRQVLIESRVVLAASDFSRDLGTRLGITAVARHDTEGLIATSGSSAGTSALVDSYIGGNLGGLANGGLPALDNRFNVNLPTGSAGRFSLSVLASDVLLDLELNALQSEGRGEVISTPRIITANQQDALIEQGREIGFQTVSQNGTQTEFKTVALSMRVKPQITPDDRVVMDLEVKNDEVGNNINNVASIDKRQVKTQVLVANGETVVLGGIFQQTLRDDESKIPLLGDIPIAGALFRNQRKSTSQRELLIFVTPKIIKDTMKLPQ